MGHSSAQLIAGKAAIDALESLGKAVVARDGEGARVGCLMYSHTQFFLGLEVDSILCPAEPVGRKGLRGYRSWHQGQGLGQVRGKGVSSQGAPRDGHGEQGLRTVGEVWVAQGCVRAGGGDWQSTTEAQR